MIMADGCGEEEEPWDEEGWSLLVFSSCFFLVFAFLNSPLIFFLTVILAGEIGKDGIRADP